jgi:hypothetical protein
MMMVVMTTMPMIGDAERDDEGGDDDDADETHAERRVTTTDMTTIQMPMENDNVKR